MSVRYNDDGTISASAGRPIACSSCWGTGFTLAGQQCGCGAAQPKTALDAYRESGQLMERAAVVAWLREAARASFNDDRFATLLGAANDIERGAHLTRPKGPMEE